VLSRYNSVSKPENERPLNINSLLGTIPSQASESGSPLQSAFEISCICFNITAKANLSNTNALQDREGSQILDNLTLSSISWQQTSMLMTCVNSDPLSSRESGYILPKSNDCLQCLNPFQTNKFETIFYFLQTPRSQLTWKMNCKRNEWWALQADACSYTSLIQQIMALCLATSVMATHGNRVASCPPLEDGTRSEINSCHWFQREMDLVQEECCLWFANVCWGDRSLLLLFACGWHGLCVQLCTQKGAWYLLRAANEDPAFQ